MAVLGDFQVGMWLGNTGTTQRIVGRLIDDPPAVVLLAGDFIYHPLGIPSGRRREVAFEREERARADWLIERAVALVRPLVEAGIPTFAVLGNHDYGMQTKQVARLDWLAHDLERALERACTFSGTMYEQVACGGVGQPVRMSISLRRGIAGGTEAHFTGDNPRRQRPGRDVRG